MNRLTTLAFIFGFLFTTKVFSQNPYFGIKAGANFSHMKYNDGDGTKTNGIAILPGVNAGITMDYRLIPEMTITANLMFSTKGYMQHETDDFYGIEINSTEQMLLFYIELPIYAKYEFEIGRSFKSFVGLGPYVGYGYWGKYLWRREGGGDTEWDKEDIYWGDDPDSDDFENIDYGAGLTLGAKFDNIVLDIGYHYGLRNISTDTDDGKIARNGVAFISVSYFFSRFYKYSEGNY